MPRRTQTAGFSLVELVIVLVIIVLLVAIVLPAVNRAREMARRSLCVSHIGQLTAAWLAYAGDNDGHLPNKFGSPAWDGALTQEQLASEGTQALWNWHDPATTIPRGQLWPYLRNLKTYICPDDPQELHWVTYAVAGLPGQTTAPGGTGTSYGINLLLGDAGNPFPSFPLHTAWGKKPHTTYHYYQASLVTRIKSPVHTYVFIEDVDWNGVEYPSVPIYPDRLSTNEPNGRLHLNASGKPKDAASRLPTATRSSGTTRCRAPARAVIRRAHSGKNSCKGAVRTSCNWRRGRAGRCRRGWRGSG